MLRSCRWSGSRSASCRRIHTPTTLKGTLRSSHVLRRTNVVWRRPERSSKAPRTTGLTLVTAAASSMLAGPKGGATCPTPLPPKDRASWNSLDRHVSDDRSGRLNRRPSPVTAFRQQSRSLVMNGTCIRKAAKYGPRLRYEFCSATLCVTTATERMNAHGSCQHTDRHEQRAEGLRGQGQRANPRCEGQAGPVRSEGGHAAHAGGKQDDRTAEDDAAESRAESARPENDTGRQYRQRESEHRRGDREAPH